MNLLCMSTEELAAKISEESVETIAELMYKKVAMYVGGMPWEATNSVTKRLYREKATEALEIARHDQVEFILNLL